MKVKLFKCDICDANFTQQPNLKQHIESDNEGKKPFKCDMCEASFAFKHHLQGHIASVHEKNNSFKCGICTSFARKPSLKRHITKASNVQSTDLMFVHSVKDN